LRGIKHLAISAAIAALAALTVLGASIRLRPVLTAQETRRGGLGPYGDPALYHSLALNLARGKGFVTELKTAAGVELRPVIFRAPGYPMFLAGLYIAMGVQDERDPASWRRTWTVVRVVQGLMDASLCVAAFLTAMAALAQAPSPARLAAGLLAALFQALNPYSAHWARTILSEPLSGFLLGWCIAILAVALNRRAIILFAASGVLAGALVLTRPEYLPWAVSVSLLGLIACRRQEPGSGLPASPVTRFLRLARRLSAPVAFLCAGLALVSPWTARNAIQFGRFIPVASGSVGELLHRGSFEGSFPWNGWAWCPTSILSGPSEAAEMRKLYAAYIDTQSTGGAEVFAVDQAFMAKALTRIRTQPIACARAWISNIPRLWYQKYIQIFADREPDGIWLLAALVLAALGLTLGGIRAPAALAAASLPVYLSLLYLPMHIEPRYSTPATSVVAALAAAGAARIALLVVSGTRILFPPFVSRRAGLMRPKETDE